MHNIKLTSDFEFINIIIIIIIIKTEVPKVHISLYKRAYCFGQRGLLNQKCREPLEHCEEYYISQCNAIVLSTHLSIHLFCDSLFNQTSKNKHLF